MSTKIVDMNMERCYVAFLEHGVFMETMTSASSNKSFLYSAFTRTNAKLIRINTCAG